jgi:hypothetical protein
MNPAARVVAVMFTATAVADADAVGQRHRGHGPGGNPGAARARVEQAVGAIGTKRPAWAEVAGLHAPRRRQRSVEASMRG